MWFVLFEFHLFLFLSIVKWRFFICQNHSTEHDCLRIDKDMTPIRQLTQLLLKLTKFLWKSRSWDHSDCAQRATDQVAQLAWKNKQLQPSFICTNVEIRGLKGALFSFFRYKAWTRTLKDTRQVGKGHKSKVTGGNSHFSGQGIWTEPEQHLRLTTSYTISNKPVTYMTERVHAGHFFFYLIGVEHIIDVIAKTDYNHV